MAKKASELNRKVLQNLRTSGSNQYIIDKPLSGEVAAGEIIVQMGSGATVEDAKKTTGLWTLAADGSTPVRFPSEERVSEMISSGAVAEVDAIEAAVGLQSDGTIISGDSSVWGSDSKYFNSASTVVNAVKQLDSNLYALSGYVAASDYELAKDDNKILVSLAQVDGRVSGTSELITNVKLSGYVEGSNAKVAATDKLGEALGKLQGQINAMDKSASSGEGQVVITTTETDGKVEEVKAYLKDITLSGYTKGDGVLPIAETDSLNSALSKLENTIGSNTISNTDKSINVTSSSTGTVIDVNIKSGEKVLAKDGNNGLYTNIKISAVTPSSTNVREEYVLYATDNTVLGDHIKIYKDSSLYTVYLGHVDDTITSPSDPTVVPGSGSEALCFIYQKEDGTYELVAVNVESFLQESEFKDGLTVNDTTHEVKVLIDSTSEAFLTVSSTGVKLSGVQDAINNKVNALNADVSGKSADNHVQVEVIEVSGKVTTVNVTTDDIASEDALEAEVLRATSAETQLDKVIGAVKGSSESRTYGHSETNYLNNNTTVKADAETIDSLLGEVTGEIAPSANTVFSSENTVAKNITDIKKDLDAFKHKLDLSAEDDSQYVDVEITSSSTGTVIGVNAITKDIADSTSSDSALADSYDVKQYAVNGVLADTTVGLYDKSANVVVNTDSSTGIRTLDFSKISIDCGTF